MNWLCRLFSPKVARVAEPDFSGSVRHWPAPDLASKEGIAAFEQAVAGLGLDDAGDREWWLANAVSRGLMHVHAVRSDSVARADAEVVQPLRRRGAGTTTLGLLSLDWNGFVREAAVRALAQTTTGVELRHLLLRRNDWVVSVRAAAASALDARLVAEYAPRFLAEIRLVARMAERGRADHRAFVASVWRLLRTDERTRAALLAGLSSAETEMRRASLSALVEGDSGWTQEVVVAALASPDPAIRLAALAGARSSLDAAALVRVSRDPYGPLAAQALLALHERFPDLAQEAIERAFSDPRASVREVARWVRRTQGRAAFAAAYRALLDAADARSLVGALAGLGETGDASDTACVAAFLAHPRPRVRRTAVKAWAELSRDADPAPLVPALADASAGVSRAARDALLARRGRVPFEACARLVRAGRTYQVRRNALHVVSRCDHWRAGPVLVRACGDPSVAALARALVHAWTVRAAVPPAPAGALAELASALDEVAERIDAGDLTELKWIASRASGP